MSGKDFWSLRPIERLGIPSLNVSDGPTGLRSTNSDPATVFPVGVALAATWNPGLAHRMGEAIAREAIAYNVDVLLAPTINIQRTPLGGRNFESYSEDPFLAGEIATLFVQGVQSQGVGTSLKHFAANNQEHDRMTGSSNMGERVLREMYLSAFEATIRRASPWSVMSAYNRINGTYASENQFLLEQVLRKEWDYDGVVVSDWGATKSTIGSVNAGLDLEMPGPGRFYAESLKMAVASGEVSPAKIDEHVERILKLIERVGLLDGNPKRQRAAVNTAEHQTVARQVATEAIVLLKNENNALPIGTGNRIAVIGGAAHRPTIQGGGSSQVSPYRIISPLEALRKAWPDREVLYAQGVDHEVRAPVIDYRLLRDENGEEGLTARYYDNQSLDGDPVYTERDWRLLKLGFGKVGPLQGSTAFAVEWSGTLIPESTGAHEFMLSHSSPEADLTIDGVTLIGGEMPIEREKLFMFLTLNARSAGCHMVAGQSYALRMRYRQPADTDFPGFNLLKLSLRTPPPSVQDAIELASTSDVAIVFAAPGTTAETEGEDRKDMSLSKDQVELIESISARCRKTIVVLNSGSPVEMPWADHVDAIVQMWLPGQEGGYAIADILSGKVSPSGKLPVTFPRIYRDTPSFLHYPGGRQVDYGEGLFVGYRYFDKMEIEPLFPFGHGLTYTRFEIRDVSIPAKAALGDTVRLSLNVSNTGMRAGQDTVQVYIEDRATRETRPLRQLKSFEKIFLEAGESTSLSLDLGASAFTHYDIDEGKWLATPGSYLIHVGFSSVDLRQTIEINLYAD
ncbi:beta-glucosidase H [Hyphomonas sp.]|uniref:beta-glucosidase n=1 Tax=Hyphomonas sp. TaxID=87 RepID=UPI003F70FE53